MYLAGMGLKTIAHRFNEEGVPSPAAGRRGSGSWAPTAIRAMLLNPRYRGIYTHGRVKKVRQNGTARRMKADPQETIVVEIPEWRIIDDETWFAVHERFSERRQAPNAERGAPARYALTGLGKCAHCGGSILSTAPLAYGGVFERKKMYACSRHHQRGNTVCPVTVQQPVHEVKQPWSITSLATS